MHKSILKAAIGAAMIAAVCLGVPARAAEIESAIARGARLYDTWYKENKVGRPDDVHPAYPASGKFAKNSSWRCKECHGWDFKGKDGQYGDDSHATGIKGIRGAAGKDPATVVAVLKDKTHGFTGEQLSEKDLSDLALFVTKGQYDVAKFIDPATHKPKGNAAKGEAYFNTLCAGCHGQDGKKVSTGEPLGKAAENPYAMLFKAFHGQPAEAMPALRSLDSSIASDIVAYSQTLPK